jgi:hypothetical protein
MAKNLKLSYLLISTLLSSCVSESSLFVEMGEPTAKVAVNTRSNLGGAPYLFPVHVYVFTTGGLCVDYQMLTDADDELLFALPAGSYIVSALAGASTDRYVIPGLPDALASSPLALIQPAAGHAELEAGRADITLTDGEEEELILTVSRVVAQMRVTLSGLPEDITGVQMSFQPLQTVLRLDGSFEEEQSGLASLQLTKNNEGDWCTADSIFIFPGEEKVTIGIVLTDADSNLSYAYNAPFKIEANYKYEVAATYKAGAPDLNGLITGTDWAGEQKHVFDFGEGAGTEASEVHHQAGDFYKDCYILCVEDETANEATLTLLAPNQKEPKGTIGVADAVAQYTHSDITDWGLLTEESARILHGLCVQDITGLNELIVAHGGIALKPEFRYLYESESQGIRTFPITGTFNTGVVNDIRYKLRFSKKLRVSYR